MAIPATAETWLSGYIPDLPTPFDASGAVGLTAFRRLCERQIAAGVSALVVGETAGESSTLSPAEHESIIRAAVDVARGRSRVIAGAGSNSTDHAIDLTCRAEDAGAGRGDVRCAVLQQADAGGHLRAFPRHRRFDRAACHPA
jgi:4-hydroxy-tetrahydrodipicolinate synthase